MPPRGSPVRLPLLLAALLIVLIVVQLAEQVLAPASADLPNVAMVARFGAGAPPVEPAPVFVPAALSAQPLFSPVSTAAPGSAGAPPPPDPLGGAVIAGVVQRGTVRLALVQGPGTKLRYVAPGGRIAGWRLVTLGPGEARLSRGHDHLDLAYGAHAVLAAPPQSADQNQ